MAQRSPKKRAATKEPTTGQQVCDHLLGIISSILKNGFRERELQIDLDSSKDCYYLFTHTRGRKGRKYGRTNAQSFQAGLKAEGWEKMQPEVERAARLHGHLCNLAADFLEAKDGEPVNSIPAEVFTNAGVLVRTLCRRGAALGPWCSWP